MALEPLLLVFAVGASVGSFIKLCADRWPVGKSVVWPSSHCDACQTRLRPVDLVPVLSYVWLRGRCRHCGASISAISVVVEVVTGVTFTLLFYQATDLVGAAVNAVHVSLFLLVALTDLRHLLILNKVTYPWAAFAIGTAVLRPEPGLSGALSGAAVGFVSFAAIYVLSKGGMGLGDVKLATIVGLILGLPLVLEALVLAAITGGLAGTFLLVTGSKGRKDALPFGVFLAAGGIVTLLWGTPILEAYMRLSGWSR